MEGCDASFLCVSANPAIDKRMHLERLVTGQVNRAREVRPAVGGKAAHVAMVLLALGARPRWIGTSGGASGNELVTGLRAMGIEAHAVSIRESTRVNLEIIDAQGGVTEILEPGPKVAADEWAAFHKLCRGTIDSCGRAIIIFSGSLPPGVPEEFYRENIDYAHARGHKGFLDTSGAGLRAGLAAQPDFVKPNREEAQSLTGKNIRRLEDAVEALQALMKAGAKSAAISLGAEGLVWRPDCHADVLFAPPVPVEHRSTVGSGDAAVAGFAFGLAAQMRPEETLRLAAACGTANCLAELPGRVQLEQIEHWKQRIRVERL